MSIFCLSKSRKKNVIKLNQNQIKIMIKFALFKKIIQRKKNQLGFGELILRKLRGFGYNI